ncbi:tripartite motif-containing protein 2-like isoform X3 [Tigriopus californicus]|uniref:tripartite motif-containing protein 2-like isoform X3 n=1 Tax=Tigriopus californicus TaxID=6832 RepID=UPI0027DAB3E1|nr:tripartite motif-containing protein 2-like isoform X3 [Tigriopus californicus]
MESLIDPNTWCEYRQAMMTSMSSNLVETVSIDYEDFNESFLTCGTCLLNGRKSGMYDGGEHLPKLLPCSHTVCLQCLDRIVATFARDTGQFRCPICRELITIPRGGVQALPPSFLVNQLLDLMARQRREIIPKCSIHQNQELLFCETCDTVFCTSCIGGSHVSPDDSSGGSVAGGVPGGSGTPTHTNNVDHTVIPFSIAIKRMSEILIYKANECRAKLNEANDIVKEEIHRLDHNADEAFEAINSQFQTVLDSIEKKRQEVLDNVKVTRDDKKKLLEDQQQIIQAEKSKVDADVQAMRQQVEVRNITKKISDLNCKLDTVSTLSEPRENSYMQYVLPDDYENILNTIIESLDALGKIKTSKTFPSLCRASMETAIAHLEMKAKVTTIDYNGVLQTQGGDPVTAEVVDSQGETLDLVLTDNSDGTYELRFTPQRAGTFCLKVLIFGRPIKDCPLFFDVSEHNPPVISFGSKGNKDKGFMQPCNVAVDSMNNVYVIDTGNSRIKRLSSTLDFQDHIHNSSLEGRSVTGICMGRNEESLMVINWRSKTVAEINMNTGETVSSFTHDNFVEPIDVALNNEGHVLVADNGFGSILVFDVSGELLHTIGSKGSGKGQFKDISAVCVSATGEIVVADSRIQVFSPEGKFLREIYSQGKNKGRYGGLACDSNGFLVATRTEKAKSFIQVFRFESGQLYSTISSDGCRMKRPTGIAVMGEDERHLVVVDIGNDCVRKYRYF